MDPLDRLPGNVNAARSALKGLGIDQISVELEVPSTGIADFAIPCFSFSKVLKKAPVAIAEELAASMPTMTLVARVWAEKGYLNFELDRKKLASWTLKESH